jgi:hypothetical protein
MANFDLHRFVTAGNQEKCVDISLAVEMMYMATVPDAYDVAVIITGDKDFIPAMQKTRLLGKRVVLCSMRNSCNREMLRPEHMIRDFDPVWLDDFIEDLVVAKDSSSGIDAQLVSTISSIIQTSADQKISSRELGRVLMLIELEGITAHQVMKRQHSSLRSFLEKCYSHFEIKADPKDFPEYFVTLADHDNVGSDETENEPGIVASAKFSVTDESSDVSNNPAIVDLNDLTVKELQGRLRDLDQPTSGTKAILIERLQEHLSQQQPSNKVNAASHRTSSNKRDLLPQGEHTIGEDNVRESYTPHSDYDSSDDDSWTLKMIYDFLTKSIDGEASSRNIGRYLQTLPVQGGNALSRLKQVHGSLIQFLTNFSGCKGVIGIHTNFKDKPRDTTGHRDRSGQHEFIVHLIKKP